MISHIDEAMAMAAAMFINFSGILKEEVHDSNGLALGTIWDISATLGEVYPKIAELIILKKSRKKFFASVPWKCVASTDGGIFLNITEKEINFQPQVMERDFLLKRDILDQQVVDTFNHKVKRVNDIHLLKVDNELIIAHVDIGLRSLFRRLGWEEAIDVLVRLFNKESDYLKKLDIISWKYVQPVSLNPGSMTMKLSFSEKQLQAIPAVDLGDIIFDLNTNQRMALFMALDIKTKAKVFENLEFEEQRFILKELDKKEAAQIVERMSSDEATDLLERLPRNTIKNLLTLIESTKAKKLSMLLGYSSESAGGLMTTEYVAMPETISVEAAIEYIRTQTKEFEVVPYIYVVDEKNHLKGFTTIRRLLFADPKDSILKTIFPKTLYVYLNNSSKEVAHFMDKYKTSAIPVIDENKTLHGIITMDDILSQVISIAWRKRPPASTGL